MSSNGRAGHAALGPLLFTLAAAAILGVLVGPTLARPFGGHPPRAAAPSVAVASAVPTPPVEALHSTWYMQTVDPDIAVGEVADITVQFHNAGQVRWVRGSVAEVRLGEVGEPIPPAMEVGWLLPDRPAAQSEPIVDPGQLATFTFSVKGVAAGTFRLRLRPVVDGVTWLEDDHVAVDIHVHEPE